MPTTIVTEADEDICNQVMTHFRNTKNLVLVSVSTTELGVSPKIRANFLKITAHFNAELDVSVTWTSGTRRS